MPLPQRPATRKSRIGKAIALSILAHALLLPFVAHDAVFHVPPGMKRQTVSLVATPRSQVQHAQAGPRSGSPSSGSSSPLTPQLPKALEAEPHPPARIDGQIVSLGPPTDERAPDKPTRYLSEHDSRVLKETRARETSAFYKNALSKVQKEGKNKKAGEDRTTPTPLPGERGQNGGVASERDTRLALRIPDQARRDALHIHEAPDGTVHNRDAREGMRGSGDRVAIADPEAGRQSGQTGIPGMAPGAAGQRGPLKLTLDNPFQGLGPIAGGPMPDELRGVEEGDETLLNSRSFKYAGFLNRVKETVGRVWTQRVQDEATKRDPSGQLYSYKDRRTVIDFTLDKNGEIVDVHVVASSGVEYLDTVAVEAFRIVQRFPNPPPGLLGDAGNVRLPFAFTLLSAGGGPRIQVGPAYLPGSPASRGY